MEITGRLTADASVHQLNDDREVVNFGIAINDRFKTKAGEQKEITTYISCAYWLSSKISQWLTKGTLVELYGRIGMDAYLNNNGDAVGKLTFHVNNIKILASAKKNETVAEEQAVILPTGKGSGTGDKDDLPF